MLCRSFSLSTARNRSDSETALRFCRESSHCAGALYFVLIDGVGREFKRLLRVHTRLVPDAGNGFRLARNCIFLLR